MGQHFELWNDSEKLGRSKLLQISFGGSFKKNLIRSAYAPARNLPDA